MIRMVLCWTVCAIFAGLLAGCGSDEPVISSTQTESPEGQTSKSTSIATFTSASTPARLYQGEAFEKEVADDDMLQLMAWVQPPARLSIAVHMNRLNGSVILTTATTGKVVVQNPTAPPIKLELSTDEKYLYADLPEPLQFPLETTFTLAITGEHAHNIRHGFTLRELAARNPID